VRVELWDDNALVSHPICNQGIRDIEEAIGVGTLEVECDSGATVILVVEPPKARLGIGLYYEVRGKEVFVSRVIAASAAGRADLKPGDQILSVAGHPIREMESGELEGLLSMESGKGFDVEVRSPGGEARKVLLRDEPMYPVKGEGIELLSAKRAATGD
jgi:S1-C subfamily serine protease